VAENRIGEIFGGEGEDVAGEGAGTAGGAGEALAVAAALDTARHDPVLSGKLGRFVDHQSRLVEIQSEHLHEQRTILLSQLKIRRFTDSLKAIIQLVIVVIVGGVMAGVAAMAWEASQDHSLVVEAFSVPPDVAAQGLTGQVVAKQVLDQLSELQAKTDSVRPANSYSNNWGEALKVEIPETGVSLDEARQYLHTWLGHETHITGEVFETPAGLTVVARVGEEAAKTQVGPPANLQTLLQKTAEAIYAETQPYRYGVFVWERGETAEARATFAKLTSNPLPIERAWADAGLRSIDSQAGDLQAALHDAQAALTEVPGFVVPYVNIAIDEDRLGHDEAARDARQAALRAADRRPNDVTPKGVNAMRPLVRAKLMSAEGDFGGAGRALTGIRLSRTLPETEIRQLTAVVEALDHDPEGAKANAGSDSKDPGQLEISVLIALEKGDSAALNFARSWAAADEGSVKGPETNPVWIHDLALRDSGPYLALAEARFGDPAAGAALAASLPVDCYPCQWAKGDVAALKGDRVHAEQAFAAAITDAPHLPKAYLERGVARLGWGDLAGALADAQKANQLGPRYADPLKLWGDILARQGDWRGAKAKYDAALPLAPAWIALKAARAQAAGKV
jgi:tetratricopeptide (TPR) repeat protein